jgi:ABC-type sugar transport system permease subunit
MKYVLLAPLVLVFGVFVAWPLFEVVGLSLTETNFITSDFVGLANYRDTFRDRSFATAVVNSAAYIVLVCAVQVGTALTLCLLAVDASKRLRDVGRFLFYAPQITAGVIMAQSWRWVFHLNGPVNWMLGTDIAWFASRTTGIPVIALIVSSATIGVPFIVFLAGALGIDRSLIDAARIDGASRFQIKVRVIVPHLARLIWAMVLLAAIAAPQVFETIYALAPYDTTMTMTYHIFRTAFVFGDHGLAAAQAVVLLVAMVGMAYAQKRLVQ